MPSFVWALLGSANGSHQRGTQSVGTFSETVFGRVDVEVFASGRIRDEEGDHVEPCGRQVLHWPFGPFGEARGLGVIKKEEIALKRIVLGRKDFHFLEAAPPPFFIMMVPPLELVLLLFKFTVECFEPPRLEIRTLLAATVVVLGAVLHITELGIMASTHERAQTWDVGAVWKRLLQPGLEVVLEDARVAGIDGEETRMLVRPLADNEERCPERLALVVFHCFCSRSDFRGRQMTLSLQQHPNGL